MLMYRIQPLSGTVGWLMLLALSSPCRGARHGGR